MLHMVFNDSPPSLSFSACHANENPFKQNMVIKYSMMNYIIKFHVITIKTIHCDRKHTVIDFLNAQQQSHHYIHMCLFNSWADKLWKAVAIVSHSFHPRKSHFCFTIYQYQI